MLEDLIGRLEIAQGPDRELDALIEATTAVNWAPHCELVASPTKGRILWRNKGRSDEPWHEQDAKPLTASIDAAMALIGNLRVAQFHEDGGEPARWFVRLAKRGTNRHSPRNPSFFDGFAATAPLALCIASLRARQSGGVSS